MKRKNELLGTSVLAVLLVFALSLKGCDNGGSGGGNYGNGDGKTGTITLNFGTNGNARTVAWSDGKDDVIPHIEHEVTLTGETTQTYTIEKGETSASFLVTPGTWKVEIEARIENILVAFGENTVEVVSGQSTSVPVPMDTPASDGADVYVVTNDTDWTSLGNLNAGDYVVITTGDITVDSSNYNSPTFGFADNVTLIGNGTITLSNAGILLNIGNGQTVTMNANLKGIANNNEPLVFMKGTLIMNGGSISGNTSDVIGAVYIEDGIFTMNDGAIHDNSDGGVSVESNYSSGTFIMNGGTITNNTAELGGGVCVGGNANFIMNGGEISNNTADMGGGVFVVNFPEGGTLTMNGGTITGNTATTGNSLYVDNYDNGTPVPSPATAKYGDGTNILSGGTGGTNSTLTGHK